MSGYLNLGTQGATGTATGPHFHFGLKKDGKQIPLNIARKDVGQYLEVLTPGSKNWSPLYGSEQQGFKLNPAGMVTSEMGARTAPTAGASTDHQGMDIAFAPGTQLRYRGTGSVATNMNAGGAGNVSSLRTGPYQLDTFHLDKVPDAATTRATGQPTTGTTASSGQDTRTEDLLKAFLYGRQSQQKPEQTMEQQLKEQVVGGLISQALNPSNFLSSYATSDPFLNGRSAASGDYFQGIFG
jgi:hypothetical protein